MRRTERNDSVSHAATRISTAVVSSLGKQRKVTRTAAAVRKPAAGEPGCDNANIKRQCHWTPAYAGVTTVRGYREHPTLTSILSPVHKSVNGGEGAKPNQ